MAKKKKNPTSKNRKILHDHTSVGKKLVPPFTHQLGNLTFVKWLDNLLPEVIWIALLLKKFGLREGTDNVARLSEATRSAVKTEKSQGFCFISEYYLVAKEDVAIIQAKFGKDFAKVLAALEPLLFLYPKCPMAILLGDSEITFKENKEQCIALMKEAIRETSDRREKFAMHVQTTCYYVLLLTGKVRIASHLESAHFDLNDIIDYPNTEASRRLGSTVRATLTSFGITDDSFGREWTNYFWNRGFEITPCETWKKIENDRA